MSDSTDLRWSPAWARVIGADGPVVTDLIGRRIPCLTVEQRDRLRIAHRDHWPVDNRVTPDMWRVWETADGNGLRAALACATQSADRALRTHITGPTGSDDWSRWIDIEDTLHRLMEAVVLRRVNPAMAALAWPWEQVMGALPALDDLAVAQGPPCCWECKRPTGARLVTEAEATRYARTLLAGHEAAARAAYEREDAMRVAMREWRADYLWISEVQEAVEAVLNWPGKIPRKTREWIAGQLRMRLQIPLRLDEPAGAQGDLFTQPEAS